MWDSTLTVTTAASDRTFLTLAELRAVLDMTVNEQTTKLTLLNAAIAAALTAECKIASAAGGAPTLRQETIVEEFRPLYTRHRHPRPPSTLMLARRPVTSVTTVVENGASLTTDDYRLQGSRGELIRLSAGNDGCWSYAPITVTYVAGWAAVPDILKRAATMLAREWWAEDSRDPGLKSKDITGVGSFAYRWSSVGDAAIPQDVLDLLADFRNPLA